MFGILALFIEAALTKNKNDYNTPTRPSFRILGDEHPLTPVHKSDRALLLFSALLPY
jgi:hypothetical protein